MEDNRKDKVSIWWVWASIAASVALVALLILYLSDLYEKIPKFGGP